MDKDLLDQMNEALMDFAILANEGVYSESSYLKTREKIFRKYADIQFDRLFDKLLENRSNSKPST